MTSGDLETVKLLLDRGANPNVRNRYQAQTPLHVAARRGQKKVVELLLAKKADVNAKDHEGNTPLEVAIQYCQEQVAKLLRDPIK